MEILNQSELLKQMLDLYYNDKGNFKILYNILNNPKISLRVIDWFVTNYSKKNNILYNYDKNVNKINVYTSYKSQLKSYSKKYFDPFCRRERITIKNNNDEIVTTYGQLNFFRWAINCKILKYIEENYSCIDKDMNESIVYHNKIKKSNTKRKELSKSSYNKLNMSNNKVVLYFD